MSASSTPGYNTANKQVQPDSLRLRSRTGDGLIEMASLSPSSMVPTPQLMQTMLRGERPISNSTPATSVSISHENVKSSPPPKLEEAATQLSQNCLGTPSQSTQTVPRGERSISNSTSATSVSISHENVKSSPSPISDDTATQSSQNRLGTVNPPGTPPNPAVKYGSRQPKAVWDVLDTTAVILSLIALSVAVCVTTIWAWRLGQKNQLVLVGVMLNIMNFCFMRVALAFFILVERRFGHSRLQNYQAILANSLFVSNSSYWWRASLFILMAIPTALGAGYKQFLGGTSHHESCQQLSGKHGPAPSPMYGAAPLPMGDSYATTNPTYLGFNATVSFSIAAGNASVAARNTSVPLPTELPASYGYNNLLISNTSAAMLDLPDPNYLQQIQQHLSDGESLNFSANVNGTVTTLDDSGTLYRDNDTMWAEFSAFNALGTNGLSSWQLYNNYDLGVIVGTIRNPFRAFCLAGFHNGTASSVSSFYNATESESQHCRQSAMLFYTVRQKCHAEWNITPSNIRLVTGSCQEETNQTVFNTSVPFLLDAMPVMVHALTRYAPDEPLASSSWLMPSFVTNIAAMQWSRLLWMNGVARSIDDGTIGYKPPADQIEIYYPANSQSCIFHKPALDQSPWLYVILALQPALMIVAFLWIRYQYSILIGRGFGLIAILAGLDKKSPKLLGGAALSGKLKQPIYLAISVDDSHDKVRYSIGANRDDRGDGITEKGISYD